MPCSTKPGMATTKLLAIRFIKFASEARQENLGTKCYNDSQELLFSFSTLLSREFQRPRIRNFYLGILSPSITHTVFPFSLKLSKYLYFISVATNFLPLSPIQKVYLKPYQLPSSLFFGCFTFHVLPYSL